MTKQLTDKQVKDKLRYLDNKERLAKKYQDNKKAMGLAVKKRRDKSITTLEGRVTTMLYGAKASSKKRGQEFSIDKSYVLDLIRTQGYRCSLSGVEFDLNIDGHAPSLDRLDDTLGYTAGNLQVVLNAVNFSRGTMLMNDYINLCCFVAANDNEYRPQTRIEKDAHNSSKNKRAFRFLGKFKESKLLTFIKRFIS